MANVRYIVDDLDATIATLAPTGTRFRSEPIAAPGGRQEVLIEDPAGNPIELFEARK